MLENGDPPNFVLAFFRPHVTSMSVLNTHSQPQIANPKIIVTNQIALNLVMQRSFRRAFSICPLSIGTDGAAHYVHDYVASLRPNGRDGRLLVVAFGPEEFTTGLPRCHRPLQSDTVDHRRGEHVERKGKRSAISPSPTAHGPLWTASEESRCQSYLR